jgi:hypothetical protein
MADNTTLDPMTGGETIATEDIGGVKYEKVKLIDSTAGSTTPIGTATDPLQVTSATKIAGEDLTIDVIKAELRYSYQQCTADVQVKASAGFIHTVIISSSNLSGYSGGMLTLYDSVMLHHQQHILLYLFQ